jgi:hypothetical protein
MARVLDPLLRYTHQTVGQPREKWRSFKQKQPLKEKTQSDEGGAKRRAEVPCPLGIAAFFSVGFLFSVFFSRPRITGNLSVLYAPCA